MEQNIILVQEEPRGASQLVEVPVGANGLTRINFPDIQQLRSQVGQTIIIKWIRLITAKVLTNAPTVGGVVAPIAELRKVSVTLYSEGWERGQLIPLLTLNDVADADATTATTIPYRNHPTRFANWKNVDWSKSYLQYSNGTQSANSPYVFVFDIGYVKLDARNQEIVGSS
jgi:hypothetical protein